MTGQMKKLTGKCPVTDCYCEHCSTCCKSVAMERSTIRPLNYLLHDSFKNTLHQAANFMK